MVLPKRYGIFTNKLVFLAEELALSKAQCREIQRLMKIIDQQIKGAKPKIGKCRKARR